MAWDAGKIEEWCLANGKRAVQLGRDVYALSTLKPGEKAPPSRGKTEDQIIQWAKDNPMRARLLFIKLMPKLAKYAD